MLYSRHTLSYFCLAGGSYAQRCLLEAKHVRGWVLGGFLAPLGARRQAAFSLIASVCQHRKAEVAVATPIEFGCSAATALALYYLLQL